MGITLHSSQFLLNVILIQILSHLVSVIFPLYIFNVKLWKTSQMFWYISTHHWMLCTKWFLLNLLLKHVYNIL